MSEFSNLLNINQSLNLYRVIGPPGCGKTTYLGTQVRRAWESGKEVLLCSLTRAAAAELNLRKLPIPSDAIGTLHAHAYRSLKDGFTEIADTPKMIAQWNKDSPEEMHLTTTERDIEEDNADPMPVGATQGDAIFNKLMAYRARMRPVESWDSFEKIFYQRWSDWKKANDLLDFTDLLEVCLDSVPYAPNQPQVIFADERQDFSLLEARLLYKWGLEAGLVIEAGDPWQNLYEWRGSDPRVFYEGAASEERVLGQSYRVPHSIHEAAVNWIKRMPGYAPIEYNPAAVCPGCGKREGFNRNCQYCGTWIDEKDIIEGLTASFPKANYKLPEGLISLISDALSNEKTVMYIASCSYMLNPMIHALRKAGIPFQNQYRRKNGRWNPLAVKRNSISSAQRLAAFMHLGSEGIWTRSDLHAWLNAVRCSEVLPSKESYQKFKAQIDQLPETEYSGIDYSLLSALIGEPAIEASMTEDLRWLHQFLTKQRQSAMDFPIAIGQNLGREALLTEPKLTIGTIHSVKGGEADVVIVAPDLSQSGKNQWHSGNAGRAAIFRLFYVAMTRAKESLYITAPVESGSAMRLI